MDAAPPPVAFVEQLRVARLDEVDRSEWRRARRNNYLVDEQRDRQAEVRNALRLRVQRRIRDPRPAAMEQGLLDTIRRTASWWDAICDNAVEQRLLMENAARDKGTNRVKYLHSLSLQEHREQKNVQGTEAQRWLLAKETFLRNERERKSAAINGVVRGLLDNTEACIDYLDKYSIEGSSTSFIAQFGLSEVIRQSYLPDSASGRAVSASDPVGSFAEAFAVIFKGVNPFSLATPYLPCFLRSLLHRAQVEGFHLDDGSSSGATAGKSLVRPATAKLIHEVRRIPVFAIGGAKFSGKSILTDFLVREFAFCCFSDSDLVNKAISAHHVALAAGTTDDLCSEWANLGKAIEARLLSGGSLPPAMLADLFAVQLAEAQADESVGGIVFDGVFGSAKVFQLTQEILSPAGDAPLQALVDLWCGVSPKAGGGGTDPPAEPHTHLVDAWLPPPPLPLEVQQPKKDNKSRATKKSIDPATLPPLELPEVEDVAEELSRERAFMESAVAELASGHGGLLSAFFYIDCPPEEIFMRYAGLRLDRETGVEYHMKFHPPPEERVAHLLSVDRTAAQTGQLADLVFQQQHEWKAMQRWLLEHPSSSAAQVLELDGAAPMADLQHQLVEGVRRARDNFTAGVQLRDALQVSQERVCELEARRRAQEAAREAERLRIIAIYTEKGVSPLPQELLLTQDPVEAAAAAAASLTSTPMADNEASAPQPCTFSLALCEHIPEGVTEIIFPVLKSFTDAYRGTYSRSWDGIAEAARLLAGNRVGSQAHVQRYWASGPDAKQSTLDRFVAQYNAIPTSIRSHNTCKEEMHSLIGDLKTALFAAVANRKRECTALIESTTRRDAFLDGWDASIGAIGTLLAQAEATRFVTMGSLVMFYFSALIGEFVPLEEIDILDAAYAAGLPVDSSGGADGTGAGNSPVTRPLGTGAGGAAASAGNAGGTGSAGAASAGGKRSAVGPKKAPAQHALAGGYNAGAAASGNSPARGGFWAADDAGGGGTATQEAFGESVQRILSAVHGLVEKMRLGTKGPGGTKAEKKAAAAISLASLHSAPVPPGKLSALMAKALPILESELVKTQERVGRVRDFTLELMRQGEAYRQKIRSELHAEITGVVKADAAAVNTAVYVLRCRVEEERLAPRMHLGCGSFTIVGEAAGASGAGSSSVHSRATTTTAARRSRLPSFLTDVSIQQELAARSVSVHATLTAARLFELIDSFAGVAPDYQLGRDHFMLIVQEADYAGATDTARPSNRRHSNAGAGPASPFPAGPASPSAPAKKAYARSVDGLKPVADMFHAFDTQEVGFIDWREFIMHLLFWCAPPPRPAAARQVAKSLSGGAVGARAARLAPSSPCVSDAFYIPEATIEQLIGARNEIGLDPVPEDVFRGFFFFFDEALSDDRAAVYEEALWRTFRDCETGAADPYAFLLFLCSDAQPVRGAQKAFSVLSSSGDGCGVVTRAELDRMSHTHAANSRTLGRYDPFSKANQRLLLGIDGGATCAGPPGKRLASGASRDTVTFQDMRSCLIGRKMLNTLDIFRRKRFVFTEVS